MRRMSSSRGCAPRVTTAHGRGSSATTGRCCARRAAHPAAAAARTGGARELSDALYAGLYGIKGGAGARQSLFRYYQGRSSLATWLRAVLAQRYVDRVRVQRRVESLPDDDLPAPDENLDTDRERHLALVGAALGRAIAQLSARERLRLG